MPENYKPTQVLWDNFYMILSSEYFKFISFGGGGGNCWFKVTDICCGFMSTATWSFSAQGIFLPEEATLQYTCTWHFTASAGQLLLKDFVFSEG